MSISRDKMYLIVETLHLLASHFKEHAILKGGIQLALFSSPRSTNDLDFTFVPFASKKDIASEVEHCLQRIPGGVKVESSMSSKNARFIVKKSNIMIEVELSVARELDSVPMNTATLAKPLGLPPQIIRVMKPEIALAHKLAAWNERRLLRDLYDIYFWFAVQRVKPDITTLTTRLAKVESRLPQLRRIRSMTTKELADALLAFCEDVDQTTIDHELPSLSPEERRNLDGVMLSQIKILIHQLAIMS